jgi:phosphoribosylanthranilate isomerase
MLKTKIKAGQTTNLTDARYFAAWGVDWLGFCLEPNTDNYLPPANVAAIKEWVEGPKMVGEMGMQSAAEINALVEALELDAVQLGMFVGEDVLENLSDVFVFKEIVIENLETLQADIRFHFEKFEAYVNCFILVFDKNGIAYSDLDAPNRAFIQEIAQRNNILLSIDLKTAHLNELLEEIGPLGLHVKGGEEEKVGYKSFDALDDLFVALDVFE